VRAEGLSGAALPVCDPSDRDRLCGNLGGFGEVAGCRCWVVEEPKRDPAGVEFGIDPLLG